MMQGKFKQKPSGKPVRQFEDLDVWKRGCRLAVRIYELSRSGELKKAFSFKDQLRRASVLISLNIAEGYERNSPAEFRRFCRIAKGSCGELRTQIYIAHALGYIPQADSAVLIQECREISSMISGLIKSQNKDSASSK